MSMENTKEKDDSCLPMVSVIIPSFNGARFIVETLNSVVTQTYTNLEVLLIDDASIDNTEELVLNNFMDEIDSGRLIYLKNKKNLERCRSRNKGVCQSNGELIAFLDADDIWQPKHLEHGVNQILDRNYDLFISFKAYTNENNTIETNEVIKRKTLEYTDKYKDAGIDEMVSMGEISNPSGWVIRKNILTKSGGFRTDITQCEDWELLSRLYFNFKAKIGVSFKPTYLLRLHPGNTSATIELYRNSISVKSDIEKYIKGCGFLESSRKNILVSYVLFWASTIAFQHSRLKDGWKNLLLSVRLNPSILFRKRMFYVLKRGFIPEVLYLRVKRLVPRKNW